MIEKYSVIYCKFSAGHKCEIKNKWCLLRIINENDVHRLFIGSGICRLVKCFVP